MAGVNKTCLQCGGEFKTTNAEIKKGGGKYCSKQCYHKSRTGKRSTNWKGGRKKNSRGYIELYKPNHPNSDCAGYVKEHVYIASKRLGRPMRRGDVVHHKNGKVADNRIENLEVMTRGQHTHIHLKNRPFSPEHCQKISEAKKAIVHLLQRNNAGQFIKGASYGG